MVYRATEHSPCCSYYFTFRHDGAYQYRAGAHWYFVVIARSVGQQSQSQTVVMTSNVWAPQSVLVTCAMFWPPCVGGPLIRFSSLSCLAAAVDPQLPRHLSAGYIFFTIGDTTASCALTAALRFRRDYDSGPLTLLLDPILTLFGPFLWSCCKRYRATHLGHGRTPIFVFRGHMVLSTDHLVRFLTDKTHSVWASRHCHQSDRPVTAAYITRLMANYGETAVAGFAGRLNPSLNADVRLSGSIGPFAGQNLGAKRVDCVRLGVRASHQFSVAWGLQQFFRCFYSAIQYRL